VLGASRSVAVQLHGREAGSRKLFATAKSYL